MKLVLVICSEQSTILVVICTRENVLVSDWLLVKIVINVCRKRTDFPIAEMDVLCVTAIQVVLWTIIVM